MIPRPQNATRAVAGSLGRRAAASSSPLAMSATSGGLDSQPVSGAERARGLGRQLPPVQQVPTRTARFAAVRAGRRVQAALGDERVAHLVERLELADHAVAAAVAAGPAGAAPQA